MKTPILFLLFSFLLVTNISAQNEYKYFSLFKEHIPYDSLKKQMTIEGINNSLDGLAQISPDLIYFYLTQLNYLAKRVSNPDSNYMKMFNFNTAKERWKKSEWAKEQLDNIYRLTDLRIKRNKMESFLEDFITEEYRMPKLNVVLPVDSNKMEYYNFIYFTGKTAGPYQKDKDYFTSAKNAASKIVDDFNSRYKNFKDYSRTEKIKLIEDALKYWYLCNTKGLNKYKLTTDFDIWEIIYDTFKDDFGVSNAFLIEGGAVISFSEEFSKQFEYEAIFETGGNRMYTFKPKYRLQPLVNLGAGFKLKLRDEYSSFSYVDIKLFYSYNRLIEDSVITEQVIFENRGIKPNEYTFTETFSLSNTNDLSNMGLALDVLFPVFYFSPDFYFDAGLQVRYFKLSYNFDVSRTIVFEYTSGDPPTQTKETVNYAYDETRFIYTGILGFNYKFKNKFVLRSEFHTNFSFTVNLRYEMDL